MKVKHILEALHGLDDNEPVMITFFLKSHADEITEEDEQPLTDNEWSKAVEKYMKDDHIDQIACEGYSEIVRNVINERAKK
jgi:folate-dependent phosphoribosylglycinamide formyltransferase PurN